MKTTTPLTTTPSPRHYAHSTPKTHPNPTTSPPRPNVHDPTPPSHSVQCSTPISSVQFYNNGDCNINEPGFDASFAAWSSGLAAAGRAGAKVFVGAPAFEGGGTGYLPSNRVASVIQGAKARGTSNFGGVMLWDGPEAQFNVDQEGRNYIKTVKAALST